jgi:hypothetical protein
VGVQRLETPVHSPKRALFLLFIHVLASVSLTFVFICLPVGFTCSNHQSSINPHPHLFIYAAAIVRNSSHS